MELQKIWNKNEKTEHRGILNMFMEVVDDDAILLVEENIAGIVLERLKGRM